MKTAAVAIRGTLTDETDFVLIPGEPNAGAAKLLAALAADGYFVLISDPLMNTVEGQRQAVYWLNLHQLPYGDIYVGGGVPRADLYVNGLSEKGYGS